MRFVTCLWGAAAVSTALTVPAAAQQSAQLGIEEIVVTARKTAENLQVVPLSVFAFIAKALQDINPRTLSDLNNLSPSLNFQQATGRVGQGRIQMRGTSGGTVGTSKATIFLDGIFIAGNASNINFAEIERIEVVPGPQSALYGRSTFAGAVNYITRDPGEAMSVHANATAARFGDYEGSLWAGGPVVEGKLLGSGTVFYQRFGAPKSWTGSNGTTRMARTLSKSAGTKWIATPSDDLRIEARATYYRDIDQPQYVSVLSPRNRVGSKGSFSKQVGPTTPGAATNLGVIPVYPLGKVHYIPATPFTAGAFNPNAFETRNKKQGWRTNLQVEWTVADHTVALNTAHQYEKTVTGQQVNIQQPITLMTFINNPTAGTGQQFQKELSKSAELRVTSPQDQRLRYTFGFFYEKADPTVDQVGTTFGLNVCQTICTLTELGVFTVNTVRTAIALANDVRDEAPFGGIYFDITDQFTASVEARYQWEYRRQANYVAAIGSTSVNVGVPTPFATIVLAGYTPPATREALAAAGAAPIDLRGNFKKFLPRLNLQYRVNDDMQFFAVYSEGNNPGGFNTSQFIGVAGTGTTAGQRFVKEETLKNYELGMKSVWMDNRLLFNASIYYMDWSNLVTAATYFTPPPNQIFFGVNENRGTSHSKGIEAEASFIPAEGWTTRATFSYTDAVYDRFCSNNYALLTGVDDDPGPTNCRNVDGNKVDLVPSTRASIGAGYTAESNSDWDWFARGDIQFQAGMYVDEFNFGKSYPRWTSNLHIGVENETFNVEVFCRKCFDNREPERFVRFSDLRGPGATNTTNQSIGHQPRIPFQVGVRVVYDY
jgi:outer membrane receptor protein involved in Fe transport